MSKTWKWILGILAVVILLGALFILPTIWRNAGMARIALSERAPMMNNYDNFRHPMMGEGWNNFPQRNFVRRGVFPFGGLFLLSGLFRLLIPVGLLGLVVYFSYKKGKNDGLKLAAAPVAPVPAVELEPAPGDAPDSSAQ